MVSNSLEPGHRYDFTSYYTNSKEVFQMEIKKAMLKGIAKTAEKAVEGACGSKSVFIYFEPEMPKALKEAKFGKNNK